MIIHIKTLNFLQAMATIHADPIFIGCFMVKNMTQDVAIKVS